MGCICCGQCKCNSGSGKYKKTKIVSFSSIVVPTGVCLTQHIPSSGSVNFSVINPNQTFTVQFSNTTSLDGCLWQLITSSGSDATWTDCGGGLTVSPGLIVQVLSQGSVPSLQWLVRLLLNTGVSPAYAIFDNSQNSPGANFFSLSCGGTTTVSNGNNIGGTDPGLTFHAFGGSVTVQDA